MEFSAVHKKRMGSNPAQVDRATGELFINPDVWPSLPDSFKTFILLHEEGHLKGGKNGQPTADELLADKYAFEKFVGAEKESLRKSVMILHDSLPSHSAEQWQRILTMYARALDYDYKKNGNKSALAELKKIRTELSNYGPIPKELSSDTKSNWIAAAIALASTLVSGGVKLISQNKQDKKEVLLVEVNEIKTQTQKSNILASTMINEEKIGGIPTTNIIIALVVLIGIAVTFYIVKRKK